MRNSILLAATLLLIGCATATKNTPVNQHEPRRVVGTDNDVRIDAEIFGDRLQSTISIPLKYDITNSRPAPIAIADIIPETNYDADTQTVTVNIGSEVPGEQLLPRLIRIAPGEKKSFSTVARVNILMPSETPVSRIPRAMRVKVNFLGDTAQFEKLIAIPERAVYDPKLADELFPVWLERNETVYTNALPMRWTVPPEEQPAVPSRRGRRRG
ncbi:MAG TPA: hypothetical protein VGS96_14820 [Thermoanaerobaculia bacterium]|nr:hypothetical protein [Thermoanaerobaculia bacterium]